MSASNLTNSVTSLINSTINFSVSGPVTTWETRLQAYWKPLPGYSLGSVLCILIICISIFSKHITGDYKWFVLNQALANLFCSVGCIADVLVHYVWLAPGEFSRLYSSDDPPLWFSIFLEAYIFLQVKFSIGGQMTTLLATVFNRWMAIVMPNHYQKCMSARLIVLYCILCYVVLLPSDYRLLNKLQISSVVQLIISTLFFDIPWMLSIILTVQIFFKLWNHMRTTTTITEKRRLQESRMILYSLMIQIAVQFFERIPFVVLTIVNIMTQSTGLNLWDSAVLKPLLTFLIKISPYINTYTYALTCIIILITMRPYRRALLSLISPITKFCLHHLKPNVTSATTDNRVTPKPTIVNVRPAGNANSP